MFLCTPLPSGREQKCRPHPTAEGQGREPQQRERGGRAAGRVRRSHGGAGAWHSDHYRYGDLHPPELRGGKRGSPAPGARSGALICATTNDLRKAADRASSDERGACRSRSGKRSRARHQHAAGGSFRTGFGQGQRGMEARDDACREILDLQAQRGTHGGGHGSAWGQRIRRTGFDGETVPGGPGEFHLGGVRQHHVPGRREGPCSRTRLLRCADIGSQGHEQRMSHRYGRAGAPVSARMFDS